MRGSLALDPREECIQAPGLSHVLCTSWRNDNSGTHFHACAFNKLLSLARACSVELPHRIHGCDRQPFARPSLCPVAAAVPFVLKPPTGPPEDVSEPLQIFELLRQDWEAPSSRGREPHADVSGSGGRRKRVRVFASSFDAFVDEVLAVLPSLNLPVVTGGSSTCPIQHTSTLARSQNASGFGAAGWVNLCVCAHASHVCLTVPCVDVSCLRTRRGDWGHVGVWCAVRPPEDSQLQGSVSPEGCLHRQPQLPLRGELGCNQLVAGCRSAWGSQLWLACWQGPGLCSTSMP